MLFDEQPTIIFGDGVNTISFLICSIERTLGRLDCTEVTISGFGVSSRQLATILQSNTSWSVQNTLDSKLLDGVNVSRLFVIFAVKKLVFEHSTPLTKVVDGLS